MSAVTGPGAAATPIRAGFVGLGNIGRPMAQRLAAADRVELWVHDVAAEPVAELSAAGAKAAASVAELAEAVDTLCVMVRDDDQVRDVLGEVLGVADRRAADRPLTVVVHSTVAPDTPAALAEVARPYGVRVVDAPVSGGPMGAAEGTLAIMVGGSAEAFAAVEPTLRLMGTKVLHAGPVGAGTRLKLARNLLHFVSFTAATEAQRLAEAAGLDLVALGDVVRHTDRITGGAGAIMHRDTAAPIPEDDFWYGVFGHVRALGEKDLRFAIALAEQLDVDVPLTRLALDRLGPGLGLPEESA
ncbi:NAD(P)-dependent oxidoreductase [Nocardioides sp. SYSU DS0651]|uniref:NAD(P)-dependent oxidoreductase n=1 Tax=Nocardioides sp. SYSU DS0651 TaxID=3415955 RepID=UPI003F4BF318